MDSKPLFPVWPYLMEPKPGVLWEENRKAVSCNPITACPKAQRR